MTKPCESRSNRESKKLISNILKSNRVVIRNQSFDVQMPINCFYEADSLSPNASACFLAFSRRSAMLEFLLCATAKAAKFNGYCGIENSPLPPFIAAAY